MDDYTLWVLCEPLGSDVLLVAQRPDATFAVPVHAPAPEAIQRFVLDHGMPRQIAANTSTAVRVVRQAEPRLYRVPASVLKPKELSELLLALVLRAYSA